VNIYLIGYRGTGKSLLAPQVAVRLGTAWSAVDLDDVIETAAGCSIAEIFANAGEAGFRDREEAALRVVADEDRRVVATGGGVVERPANHSLLRDGLVVWLQANPEVIRERLAADRATASRRPNLTALAGIDEIRAVLTRRAPIYQALADLILDTTATAPPSLATAIVHAYNSLPDCRGSNRRRREAPCH
jgi:shikimate kinase